MKNREKFEKEIMDIACSGHNIAFDKEANKLTRCYDISCGKCAFSSFGTSCTDKIKKWCNSEYKELEVDWSKVPVDTPVLVKNYKYEQIWSNRYFANYRDGIVYTYPNGTTSWSANKNASFIGWEHAKLANEEDVKKYAK